MSYDSDLIRRTAAAGKPQRRVAAGDVSKYTTTTDRVTSMSRGSNAILALACAASLLLVGAAAADEKMAAPAATASAPRQPLDLKAPDITQLYSPQQIERLLGDPDDDKNLEEVEVERERERLTPRSPTVWGGIAAPIWAILHPLQTWRIIAPLPPDQTGGPAYERPDATEGYLEPAAPIHP